MSFGSQIKFRDSQTSDLKDDNFEVDCQTESSRHKIDGKCFVKDPQLRELTNFTLTKLKMAVKKDKITPTTIKTIETIYGKKLDQVFLESRRKKSRC